MNIRRSHTRALAAGGAAIVLAVAVLVLAPGKASFARLRRGRALNVIVITLDTTRADRLPCYGFREVDTPTLDAFAARGIRFENCISQTPLTLPSHTTIMTGTYPPFHGVRDNGGFILPPALTTMAEVFQKRDYRTAAFVAAYVLDSKWGLARGFDTYFDKFDLSRYETISLGSVQRPANEVLDEALPWLDKARSGPFFAWIHLYDPHTPYEPPPPFDKKYRHPYLGEIAFADSQLGRLWEFLDRNGLRDNTVLAFMSDHGESLGAHQESSHGFFVYQEVLHVPLIFVTPYAKLWNRTSPQLVTLADVMPTILDMAGLPAPPEVQGRSLVPQFFDPRKTSPEAGYAYSETYYPRFHYGWSDLKSFQDRRYKLILAPELELYDLQDDPRESRNLAARNPALARDLYAKATQFIDRASKNALSVDMTRMDEETRQRLAALGYVGSFMDASKLQGRVLGNPREKIGIFNRLGEARELGLEGRGEEGIKIIREIIAEDPEIIDAYFSLGNIYFKERRYKEARAAFEQALARKPDDAFTVINLANSILGLGKPDEAESLVLGFMNKGFQDSQLYHLLGSMKFIQKKYAESAAYFEKCLTLNSASAASHSSLAAIAIVQGDTAQAEEHLAKAREINPKLHNLYYNWAQLYEKRNELDKAAEAYKKELEISPKNYKAAYNLSRVYRLQGREDEELASLNKARELAPDFPLTYFYLARLDLGRGRDYEAAVELVKKGIGLGPDKADLPLGYFLLADLYNRLGREDLSQDYARKGREAAAAAGTSSSDR